MRGVLGLPLQQAKELLECEGVTVTTLEVRSKKGADGATEPRVIRQDMPNEAHAVLVFAVFRGEPNEANA